MKNFLEHLVQTQKTYEFRVKLADVDPAEIKEKLTAALDAYGLESLSESKRLPIKENDLDFPSMINCQLFLMDAVLKYPVTDAQLRAIISERAGIPTGNIVVVPKFQTEEIWRYNESGESELREYKQGESVLDKPYEADADGKKAGDDYAKAGTLLKELSKIKFDVAGNEKPTGETTNDLETGKLSPVGSTQNNITDPVKGK